MAKGTSSSKKKGNTVSVDMTGVETSTLIAEGDYSVKVAKVESKTSESSGKPMLAWEFEIISDESTGSKLFYNTSLQPQALFNLKNLLICLGVDVPSSKINLDLDDLMDRECGVTVGHEVYDGKKKARITDIYPLEDSDGDEDGDEEDEEEEEDGEEEEDDDEEQDYSEMELPELKELCKERGIKILKKDTKDTLIEKLEAADEEEDV